MADSNPNDPTVRLPEGGKPAPDDALFGATLVREGVLTQEQLKDALESQKKMRSEGLSLRLGELLVRNGALKPDQVRQFMSLVGKQLLHCAKCGKNFNVKNWSPEREVFCPTCSVALVPPASDQTLDAHGSNVLPRLGSAGEDRGPEGKPFGRYRLLEELGRGGMGVVWKAWDTKLKRVVALKQILAGEKVDAEAVERFIREAQLAAKLRHPNIVAVHDVGEHDGARYFTTDYIPARSLDAEMKRGVPVRQALEWVKTAAEALAYAHEEGVVHRDVKPANFLVDGSRRIHVMDFGLATEVDLSKEGGARRARLTVSGAILGTPQYMSPEQAVGETESLGPATDQFSLGVVLYELLTGKTPFRGKNVWDLLRAIGQDEPVRPTKLNPRIHRDVETICLKALEKEPGKRYGSMAAFAADIGRYLEGEPIEATPASVWTRLKKKVARRKAVVVVGGTGILAVVSILTGLGVREYSRNAAIDRARNHVSEGNRIVERQMRPRSRNPEHTRAEMIRLATSANREFEKALDDVPDYPEALAGMAAAHILADDKDRALGALNRAIGASPTFAAARLDRVRLRFAEYEASRHGHTGDVLAESADARRLREEMEGDIQVVLAHAPYARDKICAEGFLAFGQGDYGKAEERLGEYLREAPEDGAARYWRGHALFHSGKLRDADSELTETLRMRPRDSLALNDRGNVRSALGKSELAIADFDGALAISPGVAATLQNRGRELRKIRKLDDALRDLDEAIRLSPGVAFMHVERGRIHLLRGDSNSALGDLNAAVTLDPGSWQAFSLRAAVHAELKDRQSALRDSDESVRLCREPAHALVERGQLFARLADTASELEAYDAAIKADPRCAKAFALRGSIYYGKGENDRSISDCTSAIQLDPEYWGAHYQRGVSRAAKGEHTLAIKDLDEAARLDPSNPEPLAARARSNIELGNVAEAQADVQAILKREPKSARAYETLAQLSLKVGRPEQAIAELSKALEFKPGNAPVLVQRGNLYAAGGKFADAIADYTQALAHGPRLKEVLFNRATASFKNGDAAACIRDMSEVLNVQPGLLEAHYWRGLARNASADFRNAVDDWNAAIQARPEVWEFRLNRACALRGAGNVASAISDLRKAVSLEPRAEPAWDLLGDCCADSADYDAAIDAYGEFLKLNPRKPEVYWKRVASWESRARQEQAESEKADASLEGAISDLGHLLDLTPEDLNVRARRAHLKARLGNLRLQRKEDDGPLLEAAAEDFTTVLKGAPKSGEMFERRGNVRLDLGKCTKNAGQDPAPHWQSALEDFERASGLLQKGDMLATTLYNQACAHCLLSGVRAADATGRKSRADDIDQAILCLERAMAEGWKDLDLMKSDSDLEPLRTDQRFRKLVGVK